MGSASSDTCSPSALNLKQRSTDTMSTTISGPSNTPTPNPQPNKGGLEGVVAATTALSKVEAAGRLIYHGYSIHDLARTVTFEEVAHLLWFGHLPNRQELANLQQ